MRTIAQYEWLEHTADILIRIKGQSEADLHESAVLAMSEIIAEGLDDSAEHEINLEIEAETPQKRLLELLRELLFLFEVDGTLIVAAQALTSGSKLELRARAVTFDPRKHQGLREIKAITYHQLDVRQEDDGWTAEVLFDV